MDVQVLNKSIHRTLTVIFIINIRGLIEELALLLHV